MLLVHLFVCFVRVCFCPFTLPLGDEGWLRFVIVAYPGPFYYFFVVVLSLYGLLSFQNNRDVSHRFLFVVLISRFYHSSFVKHDETKIKLHR